MIVKYHEVSKIDLKKYNYFLFYGDNEGLKEEIIEKILTDYIGNFYYLKIS